MFFWFCSFSMLRPPNKTAHKTPKNTVSYLFFIKCTFFCNTAFISPPSNGQSCIVTFLREQWPPSISLVCTEMWTTVAVKHQHSRFIFTFMLRYPMLKTILSHILDICLPSWWYCWYLTILSNQKSFRRSEKTCACRHLLKCPRGSLNILTKQTKAYIAAGEMKPYYLSNISSKNITIFPAPPVLCHLHQRGFALLESPSETCSVWLLTRGGKPIFLQVLTSEAPPKGSFLPSLLFS